MSSSRALALQGVGFGPLSLALQGALVPVAGHNLNTRAIAIQGIGFGPRVVALQGFWPPTDEVPDEGPIYLPRKRKAKRHDEDDDDDVLVFFLLK